MDRLILTFHESERQIALSNKLKMTGLSLHHCDEVIIGGKV